MGFRRGILGKSNVGGNLGNKLVLWGGFIIIQIRGIRESWNMMKIVKEISGWVYTHFRRSQAFWIA